MKKSWLLVVVAVGCGDLNSTGSGEVSPMAEISPGGGSGGEAAAGGGGDARAGEAGEGGTGKAGQGGEETGGGGTGCGNGQKEDGEECDGSDAGATCASVVGPGSTGTLACSTSCTFDSSGCSSPSVPAVAKPSCNELAKTCGFSSNDDCCATDTVAGGTFPMGQSTGTNDEKPEHQVEVATFQLDRYEVTVGRFRKFVAGYDAFRATLADGVGAHPLIEGSGWQSSWTSSLPTTASELASNLNCDPNFQIWTDIAGANETKPQNCVTWYEAFAFCLWDEGRIPTEAEWEYAAAGGAENRLYPWGEQDPNTSLASYSCLFDGMETCNLEDLPVVGSTPAGKGRYGQMDLAGSLYEWNLDGYNASWYQQFQGPGSCKNCGNISDTSLRVIRGGFFNGYGYFLRTASRTYADPTSRDISRGLRCARNVD